jgi:MFS family permease
MPLAWISRDAWLMILARFLRTFAQTSVAVFFAIYLELLGYSLTQIGLLVTLGSVGSAVFAFLVIFIGDTFGRRRLLVAFSLMMGVAGLGFALTDQYLLLAILVFFVGSLAISGGGPRGPVQPLEMAALPDTAPAEKLTDLYAVTGIMERVGRFMGALAAALPPVFVVLFGVSELGSFKLMFVGYTALMLASTLMYGFLSPAVDSPADRQRFQNPFKLPSRRTIFTLAGIYSMDSFATRFVFFSLVALWFKTQYGLNLAEISSIYAFTTVLNGVSLWIAAKLSNRIGLLNTVVFTHIPAVIFTFAVPFAPWAWLAVLFWFARGFFSQMDNPPKQAYNMTIVNRNERAAMAGIGNVSQATFGAVTPSLATLLWEAVSASAPFVAAGILKTVYLAGLYLMFRDVHPPEEQARMEARRQQTGEAQGGQPAHRREP